MKKISNLLTIIVVLLLILLLFFIKNIYDDLSASKKGLKVLEQIEEYGYSLNEKDTELFKTEFKKLKDVLSKEEIDNKEYAECIGKLFIIDFYSLVSATNKNDVGGIQFIKEDSRDNFLRTAKDTIYDSVENNIYGNRKQQLPNVKEVNLTNIDTSNDGNLGEVYILNFDISYDEDMGYPTSVKIQIASNKNKLEIISID